MPLFTFEVSEAGTRTTMELEDGAVAEEAARRVTVLFAAQTAAKWIGGRGRLEVTDSDGTLVHTLNFEETDDPLVREFSPLVTAA